MVSTGAFDIAAAVKPGPGGAGAFGLWAARGCSSAFGRSTWAAQTLATACGPAARQVPNLFDGCVSVACQALPWRPRLDLDGRTRYTLGGEGGRISSYDEAWAITPSEALWMLVKPFSE